MTKLTCIWLRGLEYQRVEIILPFILWALSSLSTPCSLEPQIYFVSQLGITFVNADEPGATAFVLLMKTWEWWNALKCNWVGYYSRYQPALDFFHKPYLSVLQNCSASCISFKACMIEAIVIRNVKMYPFNIFPLTLMIWSFSWIHSGKPTESWKIPPFWWYLPGKTGGFLQYWATS